MAAPLDLPLDDLRRRTSARWSRIPDGVLPAWTAEMDVRPAPAISEALHRAVDLGDFGYAGDPTPVTEAFGGFALDTWGWDPRTDGGELRLFADVGQGVCEVLRHLVPAGGPVVLNPPVYLAFYPWLASLGLEPLEVPLLGAGPGATGGRLDLDGMERAFASGARVALLCSPHNPLGYVYSREELTALAELADAHGAVVIADEIHAPLTHPSSPHPFVPFLSVSEAARRVGVAMHSPSKAWNTAGLKLAIGVTASAERWPAAMPPLDWSCSILGQHAAVAAYTGGREWLVELRGELEARQRQLVGLLAEHLPQVGYDPGHASYLAWLDLRALGLGDDPAASLLERSGVLLSPGPAFGAGGDGFARLNFGTSADLLTDIVRRLATSLRT